MLTSEKLPASLTESCPRPMASARPSVSPVGCLGALRSSTGKMVTPPRVMGSPTDRSLLMASPATEEEAPLLPYSPPGAASLLPYRSPAIATLSAIQTATMSLSSRADSP